jgi:hypothetical protein
MDFRSILSRVKNATFGEILYRIREAILVARLGMSADFGDWPLPVPAVDRSYLAGLQMPALDVHLSVDIIEGLLGGEQWSLHTDIGSINIFEERVRRVFFSRIKRHQDDPDIRAVWESARLQHVTVLLLYASRNSESVLSGTCKGMARELVMVWLEKNPFLFGPHYISVMECGLRMLVFFFVLAYLPLDSTDTGKLLTAMYHHAWWIEKRLSLYSSLGNHTVCECVGLVFAGAVFGVSGEGKRWLEKGMALLGQELKHQVLSDGGPAEQSLNYHRFVLDLYWLVIDLLESNGLSDCSAWKPRLLLGEAFIAAFQDEEGNLPSIGDSDDGHAVAPLVTPKRGIPAGNDEECITFPDAGYTVIRAQSGILFTFDHGPLGMAPLYNHGHAGALSITLSVNGVRMLVDPGTYRYNEVPECRKYFKGTRAHNTVTIDGQDQAVQETGFIWSHPYTCRLLKNEQEYGGARTLEAEHDGYDRLREPVLHRRLIFVTDSRILIRDTFSGKGTHRYELNYHLHPDCQVSRDGQWFKVAGKKGLLFLRLIGDGQFNMVSGHEAPPFGWYSPAYNVKLRSHVLSCHQEGTPDNVSFITAICTGNTVAGDDIEAMAEKL